jgi:hypothetical protein
MKRGKLTIPLMMRRIQRTMLSGKITSLKSLLQMMRILPTTKMMGELLTPQRRRLTSLLMSKSTTKMVGELPTPLWRNLMSLLMHMSTMH